jgi:hypothetical protein
MREAVELQVAEAVILESRMPGFDTPARQDVGIPEWLSGAAVL